MTSKKSNKAMILATAAAALLATVPVSAETGNPSPTHIGQCWGVNSCKGSSSCKTASSACAGQNSCKSDGFVLMTVLQCDEFGGDFMEIGDPNL